MAHKEDDDTLAQAIDRLSVQMAVWNRRHRFWRFAGLNLMRGLMLGLGTAIGATALVSFLLIVLSQIEFIPILGDWASTLIQEIEAQVQQ